MCFCQTTLHLYVGCNHVCFRKNGLPQETRGSPCPFTNPNMDKISKSTLNCAGYTLNIELLGAQEENGDRDRDQYTACKELGVVELNVLLLKHGPQTNGDGVILGIVTHDDLSEDIINPRSHEGSQQSVGDDRLGQRQNNVYHGIPLGCAVNISSLIDGLRNGIKETFRNVEAHTGTT